LSFFILSRNKTFPAYVSDLPIHPRRCEVIFLKFGSIFKQNITGKVLTKSDKMFFIHGEKLNEHTGIDMVNGRWYGVAVFPPL